MSYQYRRWARRAIIKSNRKIPGNKNQDYKSLDVLPYLLGDNASLKRLLAKGELG